MNTKPLLSVAIATLLSACAIGPDYKRPDVPLSSEFKYEAGWQALTEGSQVNPGNWWAVFNDAELDRLLAQAAQENLNLAQAAARYDQAEALVRSNRAGFFPQLSTSAGVTRQGGENINTSTRYQAGLNGSWTLDLWGRVRRQVEAANANLQASEADLAAVRLSVQLALAESYIRLRVLDQQKELLEKTKDAYERSLKLTQSQFNAGIIARADVIQSETQLQSLLVQISSLAQSRVREKNAIAVLLGQPPSAFSLSANGSLPALPALPQAVPSTLLTRRPDVVIAERQLIAANAQIGVARSAWLPTISIGAQGNWGGPSFSDIFNANPLTWSVGPSLALALFDGGSRRALNDQAKAAYVEKVAGYRQAVLTALQETENALSDLLVLKEKEAQQIKLVELAEENERVVNSRYRAGMITYLEVASAQNLTLQSKRSALEVTADQLQASLQLIMALGGDWQGLKDEQTETNEASEK